MYEINPHSPRADNRFANVTPTIRKTDLETKYLDEIFKDWVGERILT
jgi:hypothetical protein